MIHIEYFGRCCLNKIAFQLAGIVVVVGDPSHGNNLHGWYLACVYSDESLRHRGLF